MTDPHRSPDTLDHTGTARHDPATTGERTLAALLPWGVSLAIHGALVVLALFVIAAVVTEPRTEAGVQAAYPSPERDQHRVVAFGGSDAGGGDMDDLARWRDTPRPPARAHRRDRASSESVNSVAVSNMALSLEDAKRLADDLALPGASSSSSDQPGPRRVVYLVDASGSLVDTFPFVTAELKRSLGSMPAGDLFTVILFRDGQVIEPQPLGLKEASPRTRLSVMRWVDQAQPRGRTGAVSAIERALSYRPHDVILLSDNALGGAAEQRRILDAIARTSRGARIHTIQFLYGDRPNGVTLREGTLQAVARQTGGTHRFIGDHDLDAIQSASY